MWRKKVWKFWIYEREKTPKRRFKPSATFSDIFIFDIHSILINVAHSFGKIWIHSVWSTKGRAPLIEPSKEDIIYNLMKNEFLDQGCYVRIINGMPDHTHSLFLLNLKKSVSDVIKQVKGSSSHEVNGQNIIKAKFSWQTGFAAYSVSESSLEKVYQYIKNQKQHHRKMTFEKEYENLIRLHGIPLK